MGVSHYLFLGPYLKIKAPIREVEKKITTCTNTECKIHKKQKPCEGEFCSNCGSRINKQTFKHQDTVSPEYSNMLSQIFTPNLSIFDGFIYLIPNDVYTRGFNQSVVHAEINTPLSTKDLEKEIDWFKKTFKQEIENIQKWAEDSECKVEWGLINYYN